MFVRKASALPTLWLATLAAFISFNFTALAESPAVSAAAPVPAESVIGDVKTVRLLTVGNSFADNSVTYLPAMAKAVGKEAIIFRANPGGRSLEQHVKYFTSYEADPNDPAGSPYTLKWDPVAKKAIEKTSLKEALLSQPWDYVTIQQFSAISFQAESYEPYAGQLIAYINKHAPQAKVLVHQTWAYRSDHTMYKSGKLNPESMYNALTQAYTKLADAYGLGTIPVGAAFRKAVENGRWSDVTPDPDYDFQNPTVGKLPVEPNSLYLGWQWKKDKKTGKDVFFLDAKHANRNGRYLGACVFYATLFREEPPLPSVFLPEGVALEDAELLRAIALETVREHNLAVPPGKAQAPSQLAEGPKQ